MTKFVKGFLAAVAFLGLSTAAMAETKAVYHINDSTVAGVAMNNVKNHLSADPTAKIVVVTHGKGVDFLLDGAADAKGNPYNISVEELQARAWISVSATILWYRARSIPRRCCQVRTLFLRA